MNYADGRRVALGDRVKLWPDEYGIVVCSIDTGEYSKEYPKSAWSYLDVGILIKRDDGELFHYAEPDEDLEFVAAVTRQTQKRLLADKQESSRNMHDNGRRPEYSQAETQMPPYSASRIADHFVNYLFHSYAGDSRHVQRVASWLGLVIFGLEKLHVDWRPSRSRQLIFELGNRRYKARYNHSIKPRGGIEFVEIAKAQGSPDIDIKVTIRSLSDAKDFYDNPHL